MQIRKLVKSGYSSLVVAIPQDWIKRNKLNPGDVLYIDDINNVLTIKKEYQEKQPDKSKIIINIDGLSEHIISREINAAYFNNYSYIIIKGNDLKKKLRPVKKKISDLIALELIEESSDKIVAKSFLNMYDAEPKIIIRRMDNIVRSMMADVRCAINDPELAANIVERDAEVNRLSSLVSKVLKIATNDKSVLTSLRLSPVEVLRYWELNLHLEKIADRVKNIADILPQIEVSQKQSFSGLFIEIENMYKDGMKAFYQFSSKMSDEIARIRPDINEAIKKFIGNNCPVCAQIAINAFNITSHVNDIGRIVRYLD